MDIVFDCPHCEQELAVDSAGAGTEIECPSCGETITIPPESTKAAATLATTPTETPAPSGTPSAINSSAAAKVEKHLKVPVHDTPGEMLIAKPKPPLGKDPSGARQIRVRTIRHDKCIEAGHDKFDEIVSKVLAEIGEANIVGIHTISFSHLDVGTQKLLTTFGVMIVYRG